MIIITIVIMIILIRQILYRRKALMKKWKKIIQIIFQIIKIKKREINFQSIAKA